MLPRSFLVPVDVDANTAEELQLIASDIQEACESHGIQLAGDVHVWNPPLAAPAATSLAPIVQAPGGEPPPIETTQ